MMDNGFQQGQLTYKVINNVSPSRIVEIVNGTWSDGYIAFANGEKTLRDCASLELNKFFFSERIQNISQFNDVEGYVTEMNVWRSTGNILEEVAIEREDNSYYVQRFVLDTAEREGGNCWYRKCATAAGSHHNVRRQLFDDTLSTIEIVWPEKRFNIFMTVGDLT